MKKNVTAVDVAYKLSHKLVHKSKPVREVAIIKYLVKAVNCLDPEKSDKYQQLPR